jgi:N-acyl-L-homoserine lactone synthetase
MAAPPVVVREAEPGDRREIYRLRHQVFAVELGQHPQNADGTLSDDLDLHNQYILAERDSCLLGFVSITPPAAGSYSFQKYFPAATRFPFPLDAGLHEVRLLTIRPQARVDGLVYLLFLAAFRWCEDRSASHLVALGHDRVLPLYRSVGMEVHPHEVRSGALRFHLLSAELARMKPRVELHARNLRPLLAAVPYEWRLAPPLAAPFDGETSG